MHVASDELTRVMIIDKNQEEVISGGSNSSQALSAAGTSEQVKTHETVRKNRRVHLL